MLKDADSEEFESKFTKVSAKRLDYLESPAIGIFFVDMTQHVEQLRLESQLLEETNRNESL